MCRLMVATSIASEVAIEVNWGWARNTDRGSGLPGAAHAQVRVQCKLWVYRSAAGIPEN